MTETQLEDSVNRASTRVPVPWKNGRGVCFDIFAEPKAPSDFIWELSTAELVVSDVPFSHFPGIVRQFCVASGEVVLTVNGVTQTCPEGSITQFDGGSATSCCLVDSKPASALNLMQRRAAEDDTPLLSLEVFSHDAGSSVVPVLLLPEHSRVEAIVAVTGPATISIKIANAENDIVSDHVLDLQLLDALRLSSLRIAASEALCQLQLSPSSTSIQLQLQQGRVAVLLHQ